MMYIDNNKILHMETIDKREVFLQSPNTEREAVACAICYVQGQGINISELVTDASSSVRKMLGTCVCYLYILYVYNLDS